jgi:hypothetical protein
VVGVRTVPVEVRCLVVGVAVGMGRRVVAEGRCRLVVRCTIQASIRSVVAGGVVDRRCIRVVRTQADSNRMLEGH